MPAEATEIPAGTLPSPQLALFAREARREARGDLIRFAFLAVLALGLILIVPFAHTMTHGGRLEVARGTLVDIRRYVNERREVGVYDFVDRDGRAREATASMEPGAVAPGTVVDVIYSLDDEGFARPVNAGERFLRESLVVLALMQSLFALAVLAWGRRRYRTRIALLQHGVARTGGASRIQQRKVPLPGMPRQWRLCVSHFDVGSARWHEVRSSWRDAPAPQLAADTPLPPTWFDPHDPRRCWQPLGRLAPEAQG